MSNWQVLQGDARDVLRGLPEESVQCVVTSPPYWGLRDYGLEPTVWMANHLRGSTTCLEREHEWEEGWAPPTKNAMQGSTETDKRPAVVGSGKTAPGSFCLRCSAWLGTLGLEPAPELYVQHLVEIFREVRRVLREDGTVWLNMGDSYASQGGPEPAQTKWQVDGASNTQNAGRSRAPGSLKPKDLCGMPWRVAFALQADGWWLRSDIIWAKPNPMPESCRDRPTRSHEYVFLLTKSGTTQYKTHRDGNRAALDPDYCWVQDGIEVDVMPEGWTSKNKMGWSRANLWCGHDYYYDQEAVREPAKDWGPRDRSTWAYSSEEYRRTSGDVHRGPMTDGDYARRGRNRRSVWTIPPQPYSEAHFATFPEKLAEPCILAGTSERGNCAKCGKPWVRVVEKQRSFESGSGKAGNMPAGKNGPNLQGGGETLDIRRGPVVHTATTGWAPSCQCDAETEPAVVLDPFCGSGTVGVVALRHGRSFIGIELSEEYVAMARARIVADAPLLNQEKVLAFREGK